MVVGTTVSKLVDRTGARMTFDFDESEREEVTWYQDLLVVDDLPGSLSDLPLVSKPRRKSSEGKTRKTSTKSPSKTLQIEAKTPKPKIMVVEEEEDEDDDLTPYAKPDSDTEDETEDATMVERNKPKVPV